MSTHQKTCFKCKLEKPVEEFYRHSEMGDGRLGKCKDCTKADVRRNYHAKREQYREYDRQRAMLTHRVEARRDYARTPQGRAAHARANRGYAERNPAKRAAQIAAGNAIRDGRIKRKPCEVCGEARAQAHHDDYGKPLDVRWLCTTHHAEWHRHNRAKCPPQEKAA